MRDVKDITELTIGFVVEPASSSNNFKAGERHNHLVAYWIVWSLKDERKKTIVSKLRNSNIYMRVYIEYIIYIYIYVI